MIHKHHGRINYNQTEEAHLVDHTISFEERESSFQRGVNVCVRLDLANVFHQLRELARVANALHQVSDAVLAPFRHDNVATKEIGHHHVVALLCQVIGNLAMTARVPPKDILRGQSKIGCNSITHTGTTKMPLPL